MPGGEKPKERGTYQYVEISVVPQDLTVGTDYEIGAVATALIAAGQDERVLWARAKIFTCDNGQQMLGKWALIKCLATDALQDLNSATDLELLLKRKHILARGWVQSPHVSYGRMSHIDFEVFNVDLNDGEELRLVYCPVVAGSAQPFYGDLEYRIAGD